MSKSRPATGRSSSSSLPPKYASMPTWVAMIIASTTSAPSRPDKRVDKRRRRYHVSAGACSLRVARCRSRERAPHGPTRGGGAPMRRAGQPSVLGRPAQHRMLDVDAQSDYTTLDSRALRLRVAPLRAIPFPSLLFPSAAPSRCPRPGGSTKLPASPPSTCPVRALARNVAICSAHARCGRRSSRRRAVGLRATNSSTACSATVRRVNDRLAWYTPTRDPSTSGRSRVSGL